MPSLNMTLDDWICSSGICSFMSDIRTMYKNGPVKTGHIIISTHVQITHIQKMLRILAVTGVLGDTYM